MQSTFSLNDNPEPRRFSQRQRSRQQNERTQPLRRPRRNRDLGNIFFEVKKAMELTYILFHS